MSGSRIRLYGSTSGYVELEAPAVAPDAALTLPPTFAGVGTNVVQTVKTDTFTTTATSYTDVTGLSVTITPSSASSKVLIIADLYGSNTTTSGSTMFMVIERDGTSVAEGDADGIRTTCYGSLTTRQMESNGILRIGATFLDSPATASAVTYTVAIKTEAAGTMRINASMDDLNGAAFQRTVSSITAIEVAA